MVLWGFDRWHRRAGPRPLHVLGLLLSANALCVALLAVQLVPFAELVGASSRADVLSVTGAVQFSLHPLGALAFFVPRRFTNAQGGFDETAALWEPHDGHAPLFLTLYLGLAFVWFGAALQRLSRFQRGLWGAVALLFLALSLGKHLPGYVAVLEQLPALRAIRFPEKFLFAVHGICAAAAAIGVDRVLRQPDEGLRSVRRGAVSLAVAMGAAAVCVATFGPFGAARLPRDLVQQAAVFAFAGILAGWGSRRPRWAIGALLLLMMGDLYRGNSRLLPTVAWRDATATPRSRALMHSGESPLRIYANPLGGPALGFPQNFLRERNLLETEAAQFHLVANVNTPSTLNLRDLELWEGVIERAPRQQVAKILAAFNVQYVTSAGA